MVVVAIEPGSPVSIRPPPRGGIIHQRGDQAGEQSAEGPPRGLRHRPSSSSARRHTECACYLGQQLFDDVAVDVGQPVVAALEAVGQPFVVEAEEVQDGRLQVVDVDCVLGDVEAELVGLAVG